MCCYKSELAAKYGVSLLRLDIYEDIGILRPQYIEGNILYPDLSVAVIVKAERLGFTLKGIQRLLSRGKNGFLPGSVAVGSLQATSNGEIEPQGAEMTDRVVSLAKYLASKEELVEGLSDDNFLLEEGLDLLASFRLIKDRDLRRRIRDVIDAAARDEEVSVRVID